MVTWTPRRAAAGVLVAVLATVGLSACGTSDSAGAASVVGDQRVTDAQLADLASEVRAQLGTAPFDAKKVTQDNLTRLTRGLVYDAAVAREGLVVTESQVDDLLTTSSQSTGGKDKLEAALLSQQNVPRSAVRSTARQFLDLQALVTKLGNGDEQAGGTAAATYLGKLSAELGTQVAARYGTWDDTTLAIGPVPNDLSSPRAVPAASPSASASP